MKKILYFLAIVFVLLNTTACEKEFLDKEPLDQFSEEAVWKDQSLIQTFVNNIYRGIPHGLTEVQLSALTDEAIFTHDYGTSNINKSLVTPSDYSSWNDRPRLNLMVWENVYRNVRACNLFLENIEGAPFEDEDMRNRLKGEVHFLRAFLYHNLVSVYGGVPIITQTYALNEDYAVERDSYEDCIKFITEECDKAAELLPLVQGGANQGRATKGAALSLKARTLLYAASDLYNSNASWAPGYAHPELVGYVGGDRMARWQAAKDAAKAVMDLGLYSLYKPEPAPGDSAARNYSEIFISKETSEDIFVRYFLTNLDNDNYNPGIHNGPNGYHNWGGNTPIQQLVDDYEMKDGTQFSWNNPEQAANPYKNRDPRFYATILYEGAQWRQRPADVIDADPLGIIQVGFWEKWNPQTNQIDVIAGLDTRKSSVENWNGTYTGYYLRKYIDPTVDAQYFRQEVPWRFFRYTEVLLNYAEACLGLGQEEEARTYINMIRRRAGMPETNEGGQDLVDRYRNERRVELAFEDARFFDIRRWMIAPEVYTDAEGVDVRYKLNADKITAVKPTFTIITVQEREWNDRAYFLPIRLDEINRNNMLVQNPLY